MASGAHLEPPPSAPKDMQLKPQLPAQLSHVPARPFAWRLFNFYFTIAHTSLYIHIHTYTTDVTTNTPHFRIYLSAHFR